MSAEDHLSPLQFSRTEPGRYHARGEGHNYLVEKDSGSWSLGVFKHDSRQPDLKLSGDREAEDTHDTAGLAKRTAQHFEALGSDYRQSDHGGRGRYTEAVQRAYDED